MIPAVIVCHGALGEAYLEALAGIYGEVTDVATVTNEDLGAEELESAVAASLERLAGGGIVFTDYFGGSCANACLTLLPARPAVRLISGVNLPVLLYYLAHRHELGMDELVRGIVNRGHNSIRELSPPVL
ncbi:MAG: hypothetical protein JW819_01525 [Candidatus Krumholzibacteriota bacterium]|nr:hypothetical protein [Candidatus Krumholzibacteriota bacterium]